MFDEEGREKEGKDTLDSGTAEGELDDVVVFVSGTKRLVCHEEYRYQIERVVRSKCARAVLTFPGFALKSADLFFSSTVLIREASAVELLP